MENDAFQNQPNLFGSNDPEENVEKVILFALGEFQSRGFQLIDREMALDRLRGAFKRAAEKFGLDEFSDEKIAAILGELGAVIKQVPNYVAKHPYKIKVKTGLAIKAFDYYKAEKREGKIEK
jgi:hypothetical protein